MSESATMAMPQFYDNVIPLSSAQHSDWSLERENDYQFTEKSSSVYLACAEFLKASREYPIVFIGSEDQVTPAALLSVKDSKNHFLREDGSWDASYIPAYVRRYPFIPANIGEDETLMLSIDDACSGLNQEEKGQRLYTDDGKQTDYTKGIVDFLRNFQLEHSKTSQFCEHLIDYDLLEPMTAKVTLEAQNPVILKGFYVVSYSKLKALKKDKLSELMAADELGIIFSHLSSLDRFENLMAKAKQ